MHQLRHYDHIQLEELATHFLCNKPEGKFDNRSLLVENILESLGYEIYPIKELSKIAEAYIPMHGKRIYVDEEQYDSSVSFRMRFSLAEELAHILIHVPQFADKTVEEIVRLQELILDREYQDIEREAKYLAAALLMPKNVFEQRFSHFLQIQSQRSANQLYQLENIFRELSLDFNVSIHSAVIRAEQLKLIDPVQFEELVTLF